MVFDFSASNLFGQLIFGAVGFVAFAFGKKMSQWSIMFVGLAMMIGPYFIDQTWLIYATGLAGILALFLLRQRA